MFKFGGWKASLKVGGSSRRREVYENGSVQSVVGAYRSHREEFYERKSSLEPPKKLTPSMVKLPPSNEALKNSKSANDLSNPSNVPPQLRKSTPNVSTDPRGGTSHNRDSTALHRNAKQKSTSKDDKKESKKLEKEQRDSEKKRIAEQKKRDKLAAQEQAQKDKLRIQNDKQIAQQQAKDVKLRKEQNKTKEGAKVANLPQTSVTKALVPPAPPASTQGNPLGRQGAYSTNTLESSISRSSGPPPYSEIPKPPEKQPNKQDSTGNTSFSKPIENSSWDMISAHRNQINRNPVASGSRTKQVVMDLQFSFDKAQTDDRNNSEV